ncbi:restriction endonuclease subunit S [Klebsiella aerogenes]|uniref:restriction endonuclease subunit S n=1 Tax=Klebsiella aerogenes TaxID=548 RepID=UPI0021516472|nr:restriction endonuclease subunit S [Klebsiella aerogenes]HBV8786723.1 restriction endonuclease subunit S [Klebsiella pneumoniae]HEO9966395.1 restriction endonuclease subunit S [Klebsiella aerogenes]
MVKLGDVINVHYGKALKADQRVSNGSVHVFGSSGIVGNHDKTLCSYPTIIIGRKGSVGAITWAPDGGWIIDTAYYVEIKDNNKLDLRYLFYILSGIDLTKKTITTSIPGLNRDDLYDTFIKLPPFEEQKRIVDLLDKAEGIRQKREQSIKLADDFLRATFLEMFGDPIENPKGWNVKPLADQIVHANNGISRRRKEDTNEGDIVLRLQDVHYSGIAFDKELNRIKLVDKEKQIARVEYDDLLFIRVNGNPNYVGRTAVFKSYIEPVYHNDHLIRIKLDNEYQSDFLCYLINSPFSRKLIAQQIKTSAGQHTISQDGILKLMFYRPPIELQEKFINIKNKIESIFYRKDKHEDLFASISNKLIHSIK